MQKNNKSYLWSTDKIEKFPSIRAAQGAYALLKIVIFLGITFLLIPIFLACKFVYKLFRIKIPMILIRKIWSNTTLGLCGLTLRIRGAPEYNANIMVSNHVSWLDILVLQSVCDIVFIAKSEVRNWPGLGFLAKLADTIFVDRTPQKITSYTKKAQRVISSGETLFFFPEGTSSDGLRVLKFHSSFFQLAIDNEAQGDNPPNKLQPISIYYKPYKIGEEADF